ncbi:MAG: TolC family protein [Calditrichaeota bacterium]|nr:MAG: TolC family protein [Calditrichota bacterium]
MRCFLLLMLLPVQLVFSQDQLTIKEALDYALKNNPDLNQSTEARNKASLMRYTSLGLQPLKLSFMQEGMPELSGSAFAEKKQTLTQNIDFPLTSFYRYKSFSAGYAAADLRLDQARKNLKAEVKQAYVNLIHARKMIDLSKQKLAIARNLQETARNRFAAGEASEMEVMKTEISLAEAENDELNAELDFDNSRYALFETIGLETEEQRYDIVFPDSLAFADFSIDQHEILNNLNLQPGLMSREKTVLANQYAVKNAWSQFLPDFSLNIYRQDFGGGYDFYGFEAGFSIPLWFISNQMPAIRMARAEKRAAQFELTKTRLAFKREIENAWHGFSTSRETLIRYQNLISERSDKLLELALEGYRLGETGLLDLLDTQRTYIISRENYYNALRNYYLRLVDLEKHMAHEIVFTE